ncbi:unnamed protein product [Cuscuta epithymum]|nr:unnamed protein product [Cuscuta epithymum]
MPAILYR